MKTAQPSISNARVAPGCEPFWSLPLTNRQRKFYQAAVRREQRLEEALADAINCFDNHPERITAQRIERWREALCKKGHGSQTPSARGLEMIKEIEQRGTLTKPEDDFAQAMNDLRPN